MANNSTEVDLSNDITEYVSTIVPIIFGMITVIGAIGNIMVILVMKFHKQLRSTTNLLILNLAVADLLFVMICVPATATDYALTYWPFGEVLCKVVQYFIAVTAYASVYTLVLMGLDRFLAVVRPIASISIRTEANAVKAVIVLWLVIVLICIPAYNSHELIISDPDTPDSQNYVCSFIDGNDTSTRMYKLGYGITFFITSYVTPLALICSLYLSMLWKLWKSGAPGGRVSVEGRRGRKRVTRMVAIIVVIFATCWGPIQVILVLKSVQVYDYTPLLIGVQIASHVLAYMNSCLNPILYAFLSEHFRKSFKKIAASVCNVKEPSGTKMQCRPSVQNYGAEKNTTTTKTSKINGDIL